MKNEKIKLSDTEKQLSIEFILQNAMPKKQKLVESVLLLYKRIGIKGLFFGVGDSVFLAMILVLILWLPPMFSAQEDTYLLFWLFFLSPFAYALLHYFCVWKQIMTGTYEMMQTTRISLRQLTVLRMLLFGGFGIVFSVVTGTLVSIVLANNIPMIHSISVSFSGLFLFASFQIWTDLKWNNRKVYFIVPIIWLVLGVILYLTEHNINLLITLPTVVFIGIAIFSFATYLFTLKSYYFKPQEGALNYAYSK